MNKKELEKIAVEMQEAVGDYTAKGEYMVVAWKGYPGHIEHDLTRTSGAAFREMLKVCEKHNMRVYGFNKGTVRFYGTN